LYYPYLRGRQYELFALRDLYAGNLIGDYVTPIIEPVRYFPAFVSLLEKTDKPLYLIANPQVGSFFSGLNALDDADEMKHFTKAMNNPNLSYGLSLPCHDSSLCTQCEWVPGTSLPLSFAFVGSRNCADKLEEMTHLEQFNTFVLVDDSDIKHCVPKAAKQIVFSDSFNKQRRNSDYDVKRDELFSKEHLVYNEYGFKGFSDASIIGMDYDEVGFAPRAVAIHIVYFDEKKYLRVHHFVSENNNDTKNPGKKFREATKGLPDFIKEHGVYITQGLKLLLEDVKEGKYPGLGQVKKYSLMHHLELVERYLRDNHK